VLISLQVSIPAIKEELDCYISPARQRRRRRGKTAAGACSFCGKPGGDSLRLIAGPACTSAPSASGLCNEILAEDAADIGSDGAAPKRRAARPVADPADLAAQHRVLVSEQQEFGILGLAERILHAGQQNPLGDRADNRELQDLADYAH
jgi:hypothetical protein